MSDQIDVNQLADTLNSKVQLPDGKGQDDIDYVIDWKTPTDSDQTWYRIYKSGWVEQGGILKNSDGSATLHVVNLPITMKDTNYFAVRSNYDTSSNHDPYADYVSGIRGKTTTTISIWSDSTSYTVYSMWEVKGMGA